MNQTNAGALPDLDNEQMAQGGIAANDGDKLPPTPAGIQGQCSTSTNASQTDDLADWLDEFISTPVKKPEPRPTFVPAPPVFDAFVLFTKIIHCAHCQSSWGPPVYIGLRKPVKNGFVYLAYTPEMAPTTAGLPRYEITTTEQTEFCSMCFNGEAIPEEPNHAKFHPSRVNTLDDLRLFAMKTTADFPPPSSEPSRHHLASDGRTYT